MKEFRDDEEKEEIIREKKEEKTKKKEILEHNISYCQPHINMLLLLTRSRGRVVKTLTFLP